MKKIRLAFIFILLTIKILAQTSAIKEPIWIQATRHFDSQEYAKAIALYNEALALNDLTTAQRQVFQLNQAYAYYALGDNQKAEDNYKKIIEEANLSGGLISHYLHYAKVLANNNKMAESQKWYERFQQAKNLENRIAESGETYTKRKITYRLDYLGFNTQDAEFSPAYFKDGLVYVHGKAASMISSEAPEKGYLDLYFINNHEQIKSLATTNADGSQGKASNNISNPRKNYAAPLGSDAYTQPTANDSKTIGSYNTYGMTDGVFSQNIASANNKPIPFSKELNTRFHEGPVTFTQDFSKIIFTRNNFNDGHKGVSEDNNIKLKLYSAQFGNGDWTNTQELPFNSDEYSTAHPSLNKEGTLLYFVSDMPKGMGGKDIYVVRWEGNRWSNPINLGKELNTRQDELFPFVDGKGNLYFATAGRKGGLGGLDLYYAILSKDGTKVIEVLQLDAPINSNSDDFGLVTDDNRTQGYFSSNRRDGNDDIYRFTRESSLYECRELLIKVFDQETNIPIDSATIAIYSKDNATTPQQVLHTDQSGWARLCLASSNEFIFLITKNNYLENTVGFSTRNLHEDKPTRLEVSMSKPIIPVGYEEDTKKMVAEENIVPLKQSHVRGIVRTETDRKPIEGVLVKLRNECTKKIHSIITGADGKYDFQIEQGCDYTLIYSKDAYGTNTVKIKKVTTPKPELVSKDVGLLKKGDIVTLDNIYHDQGKESIRADAARELDKLVTTMQKYPSLRVEILSHTDSRGEASYNKTLSQKRAQAVVDYMASKGIARKRMKATGMGESMPVNGCVDGVICTEAEYQRNRRTEFRVLEIR